MPPSSRKRNKGKERKAKKANKVELERADANEFWQGWKNFEEAECMHGDNTTIADNHPVSCFLDEYFIHWERSANCVALRNGRYKYKSIEMILNGMLQKHRQVWTNENYRELAAQTFTSIGTNMLLRDDDEINKVVLSMAKTIVALEHYDSSIGRTLDLSVLDHSALVKKRDLEPNLSSTRRDLLKFFPQKAAM